MKPARIAAFTVAGSLALAVPFLVSAQGSPDAGTQAGPSRMMMKQHAHWHQRGEGHHRGEHMRARRGHGDGFLRGLDLSDEQRDRIFEIRHASAPKMREQAKVLREARGEFAKLALSSDYDEAKVQALAERNAKAVSEMAQLRAQSMNEVYQVLTPEQQAKVQERQAKAQERQSRRGPRG